MKIMTDSNTYARGIGFPSAAELKKAMKKQKDFLNHQFGK